MSTELPRPETLTPEAVLTYDNFGFDVVQTDHQGHAKVWHKEIDGQVITFKRLESHDLEELDLVAQLQKIVWGFSDLDAVPQNLLNIIPGTGADVFLATDESGDWAGFLFGVAGHNPQTGKGFIRSHMMGVREDIRAEKGLGWNLKVLQAIEAHHNGIHQIEWTADPLRSINMYLNLEKLDTYVELYSINKYGLMVTELYGEIPTDRFTFIWDLANPQVLQRLLEVRDKTHKPVSGNQLLNIPQVIADLESNTVSLTKDGLSLEDKPELLLIEIPGDIDKLDNGDKAVARQKLRLACLEFMDTSDQGIKTTSPDNYVAVGLSSQLDEAGARRSYIILQRKDLIALE